MADPVRSESQSGYSYNQADYGKTFVPGSVGQFQGFRVLTGAIQVENYINGLYMTLPSFSKFGLGVRSEEKNSDNIIAEKYDARLHGQNNQFSGASDWQTGYQNLRKVNYFFHNYKVPEAQENEDVLSLKGEAYFLRAYWHFDLLKKFGSIPVMDAFFYGKARS